MVSQVESTSACNIVFACNTHTERCTYGDCIIQMLLTLEPAIECTKVQLKDTKQK